MNDIFEDSAGKIDLTQHPQIPNLVSGEPLNSAFAELYDQFGPSFFDSEDWEEFNQALAAYKTTHGRSKTVWVVSSAEGYISLYVDGALAPDFTTLSGEDAFRRACTILDEE